VGRGGEKVARGRTGCCQGSRMDPYCCTGAKPKRVRWAASLREQLLQVSRQPGCGGALGSPGQWLHAFFLS
jgi:hypothetical protein